MLECPRCEDGLLPARNEVAMNLFCPSCTGRAVAHSSFGRGIRRDLATHLDEWIEANPESSTESKCPACRKPMVELAHTVPGGFIALKACRPCGIFWCDGSELPLLPPNPKPVGLHVLNEALTLGTVVTKATKTSKAPPVATWIFATLCVGVSYLTFRNPALYSDLAYVAAHPLNQLGLLLISAIFIHVSFAHLLGNLYFLLTFGGNIEDVIIT